MTHGWTGGQYSLYRGILGGFLFLRFARLIPWGGEMFSNHGVVPDAAASPLFGLFPNVLALSDGPLAVTTLLTVATLASLLLALGWHDRSAALVLWYLGACLIGRNPLILNPSLPFLGWLLLAHAFLPSAPYGSWTARGRVDPDGGWRLPDGVFGAAWIVMALGYTYSGFMKLVSPSWVDGSALTRVLENPLARPGWIRELVLALPDTLLALATWGSLLLELAFAPLALIARLRPWLWTAMLAMHLSLMLVIDFAELSLGMALLHLFTFDPAWIRPFAAGAGETLFYDGSCGLCHAAVRFNLAEDRGGSLRFAPIQGESYRTGLGEEDRKRLPDSIVVRTASGRLLVRSAAVRHILRRLGGIWRLAATISALVPALFADRAYDIVAAVRYRVFGRVEQACPVLPPRLRERFDS